MRLKNLFDLIKQSVNAWIDDYAPSMGAAIAYYTMFSLAPLLIMVIAVAGFFFEREAVTGQVVAQLEGLIGREGAIGVQGLIRSASEPTTGIVATSISLVVLAIGATTVFGELQSALDRIWQVPASKKVSGLWNVLRARFLSFGLILGIGFLLLVSLVVSAVVAAIGAWVGSFMPAYQFLLMALNTCISIGLATLLFAMIFKIMPQAKIAWRDVWVGALVTAVMFEIGKVLIGLYIGKSSVTSSYAAAGSLVVLLLWVYYSAQIFLLGAEFTWVYAQNHGSHASAGEPAPAADLPTRDAEIPSSAPTIDYSGSGVTQSGKLLTAKAMAPVVSPAAAVPSARTPEEQDTAPLAPARTLSPQVKLGLVAGFALLRFVARRATRRRLRF